LAADLSGPGLMERMGGMARGIGGAAKGLGSLVGLGGGGGGLPEGFDPASLMPGAPGQRKQGPERDRAKEKAKKKQRAKNRKKR
jgi:hypothetical protein